MPVNHLASFEDRIQSLIEGGLARLLAGRLHPRDVAVRLARAIEDQALAESADARYAPDSYVIRFNPLDHDALLESVPHLIQTLSDEVVEIARMGDFRLRSSPHIQLIADSSIEPHDVQIVASHQGAVEDSTDTLNPVGAVWGVKTQSPQAALILNGDQRIPMDRPLLNLGRHRDNHIILDDPGVSRHHSQIRLRFGRYTLFDLGSSGGTLVNGQSIQEATLRSGDVITMANSSLIYVEDGKPAGQGQDAEEDSTRPMVSG